MFDVVEDIVKPFCERNSVDVTVSTDGEQTTFMFLRANEVLGAFVVYYANNDPPVYIPGINDGTQHITGRAVRNFNSAGFTALAMLEANRK